MHARRRARFHGPGGRRGMRTTGWRVPYRVRGAAPRERRLRRRRKAIHFRAMQKLSPHSHPPYAGGMKSPLVTIVTPAYNQKRYIAECVESVLAQTYPHWEQIVVDDGSTDGTPEIVESYRDPRIRCIRLPHRGLAALGESYNTALAAARGELVAILEGDDLWPA